VRANGREGVPGGIQISFDVWRYRRVSTSDKGQDPKRQFILTDEWVAREKMRIVGDTEDMGTSATFTSPFERSRFIEACEGARAAGCRGLLAESVDRVCGQGSDELGWTRIELRRRYGLELFFADVPLALHGTLGGNVTATANAEVRRERIAGDRRKMREGIQTKRRDKGLPVGGQAQMKMKPDLVGLVAQVHAENPRWGLRLIAHEVSARRGAFLPSLSERERRRRKVTHETVRKALAVASSRTSRDEKRGGSDAR